MQNTAEEMARADVIKIFNTMMCYLKVDCFFPAKCTHSEKGEQTVKLGKVFLKFTEEKQEVHKQPLESIPDAWGNTLKYMPVWNYTCMQVLYH